jgi:penicillin-binding protein activator
MKNNMNNFFKTIQYLVILLLLLSGCSNTINYQDATTIETTSIDFGSTDLQQIATKMVDSLLTYPAVVEIVKNRRPVVFVDGIKNKTLEHIDTESITDTIRTRLIRSGKFRFIDIEKTTSVQEQLDYQHNSNRLDEQTGVIFGKQIGAEYMLYGNISSIVKKNNRYKDVYYKFTLNLMSIETAIIEWSDEKQIRKVEKRKRLGW